MDLNIAGKTFVVGGASSGFGKAIALGLCAEGAHVLGVARGAEALEAVKKEYPDNFSYLAGDITQAEVTRQVADFIKANDVFGVVINAGGPPATSAEASTIDQWDAAYGKVMRWKIDLTLAIVPALKERGNGRIVFIESGSVKQPIPNLVLSNAFRMGIVGFAKTLALEIADSGVTANVLAPGSHETPAIERLVANNSKLQGISYDEAKAAMDANIPVKRMGKAEEFASLALWLLSTHSGYVTGQTISHDGGSIRGMFG